MLPRRPSVTASIVALARGLGPALRTVRDAPSDPVAHDLLPLPFALLERAAERGALRVPRSGPLISAALLGLVEHMALRTAAIDDALRDGLREGAQQVVILGAGLDARAYRMPELASVTVFEVDHPATQAYKRARIEARRPTAREVRFVAVDFERTRLDDALVEAGHDSSRPTFWIWEGVTMYLAPEAMRATLAALAVRSVPGSRAAITYVTPELEGVAPPWLRGLGLVFLRVVGEPVRGRMTPAEMHAALAEAGLRVLTDTSPREWADKYGATAPPAQSSRVPSRLVVAAQNETVPPHPPPR
jgi:methyltransferase (TIGR00027 family)